MRDCKVGNDVTVTFFDPVLNPERQVNLKVKVK